MLEILGKQVPARGHLRSGYDECIPWWTPGTVRDLARLRAFLGNKDAAVLRYCIDPDAAVIARVWHSREERE